MDDPKRKRQIDWNSQLSEDEVEELQRRIRRAGPVRQPFEEPLRPQVIQVPPKDETEVKKELETERLRIEREVYATAEELRHQEELAEWRKQMGKSQFRKDITANVIGWSILILIILLWKSC